MGIDETTSKIQKVLHLAPMPCTADGRVDVVEMHRILRALKQHGSVFVALERAQAMHKASAPGMVHRDGSKQAFTTGRNYGRLEALVEVLKVPHVMFTPVKWQNALFKGLSDKLSTKEKSVLTVERRLPSVNLLASKRSRKPHDGMADAACIGLYTVGLIKAGEISV